jgi:hypothetical protein
MHSNNNLDKKIRIKSHWILYLRFNSLLKVAKLTYFSSENRNNIVKEYESS